MTSTTLSATLSCTMPDLPVTLPDIRFAASRIASAVARTPCPYSLSLSRLCGCDVYCKLDHLQMTGSFKERGARNKLMLLTGAQRSAGVIAASAGNHALALAYHGQDLGISVTVVMPRHAPLVKVRNCRSFGATVLAEADNFADAYARAQKLASERGVLFIPGFDDPAIVAGAGTVGLEILDDVPDADAIIVPVGGGGLIAGIAAAVKATRPQTKIIGVEPINAPTMHASLAAGKVVEVATRPTLADGLAVARAGQICFDIARQTIDDLQLVDEPTIAKSVLRLLEMEKMVIEGAGAVPLAAILDKPPALAGKKVVLVLAGGNIDVTVIGKIIERGLAADGRLCRVTARMSDRPGSLALLSKVLADAGASVQQVHHDRNFGPADVGRVTISCTVETRDFDHVKHLHEALKAAGIEIAGE
jgi:threonine dehydratase